MRPFKFIITAFLIFSNCGNLFAQQNAAASAIWGHFVASIPCSTGSRPLPGIPLSQDCELIQLDLKLLQDQVKKTPVGFILHYRFGMALNNTHGLVGGGNVREMKGTWTIASGGSANPRSIIFRLADSATGSIISLMKLNDDLLHLLDNQGHLMIGTAAWSYTLNKVPNQ